MCFPCAAKKKLKVWSFMENRTTGYPIKFDHNEVEELRKKFKKISGNREFIDKPTFQQNMGILGLHSVFGFSDRLFNSFDTDSDGKISFQDFVEYMQILKSGNDKNKARISFKLIDVKNLNSVTKQNFIDFLQDYFRSWTTITNSIITPQIKEKADEYVTYVFEKVYRETKKQSFDFRYYAENLFFDRDFTEAFQFITEGVANMFITGKATDEAAVLYKVIRSIKQILSFLGNDDNEHSRMSMAGTSDFFGKSSPSKNIKFIKKETTVMVEEMPKNQSRQAPKFTQTVLRKKQHLEHIPKKQPSYQQRRKTAQMNEDSTGNFNTNSFSQHSCPNCFKMEILEKKIDFLTVKLKEIIEETKNIYEKIDEKLFERATAKKKQTEGNIHHIHNEARLRQSSQGNMVFFGDDNWNLVLNMMIGIQMAVRSVRGYQEMIYEEPRDFQLKYYFELVPRRFGGENYMSQICSFTDYAPNTFNHIRSIFNIDNQEYINSIGPNKLMTSLMMGEVTSLSGLTSQGKSGSFFYYTADGKYMLKTIHHREYKHLRSILEHYYYYVKNNPNTLITKFYGLHKLIEKNKQGDIIGKSYFVIMANVFNTQEHIIERYDIKGSWQGRENNDPNPKATKKDNDFKKRQKIQLNYTDRENLMKIIRKDAEFFRQHEIIDYSLLIGVIRNGKVEYKNKMEEDMVNSRCEDEINGESGRDVDYGDSCIYQGKKEEYIFGIIDILTEYNTRKAMEYCFKRVFIGPGISAVPPSDYAERFVNFIDTDVFKKVLKQSPPLQKNLIIF